MTRLTIAERQYREMSEAQWQKQVTNLAEALGYSYVHFRAARTQHGWRVPMSGPLGKGWPDLTIVGRGRRIHVELKSEQGKVSAEQEWVHEQIRSNGGECYVWRPSDIDEVVRVLLGKQG